jgi:hypothetical protein
MNTPSASRNQQCRPIFFAGGWLFSLCVSAFAAEALRFNSPALPQVTSWMGNTYAGAKKWVQQDIRALAVTDDGTVFTNVEWEEGGGNVGEYRAGELIRYAKHTHGWGASGGVSVAANSNYVFIGMVMGNEGGGLKDETTWPPKGSKWFGVSRRWRSDIAKPAVFAGGKGGKGDTLKESFLVLAEVPEKGGVHLAGMVATEKELFVSDPNSSEIKVFDCVTMEPVRHWKVEGAGPLAMDRWGNIAMLEAPRDGLPRRLLFFGKSDRPHMQAMLPEKVVPSAICFQDNRLLVADTGPAQQILVFAPVPEGKELALERHIGQPGGILAAGGVPDDLRFNDVRALGCDAKGNLYVAQGGQTGGGSTVLESYTLSNGRLNWRLFGLTFIDMADVDPASDSEVFTKEEHLKFDYAQTVGHEWSYAGYTVDRSQYPEDPRVHVWSAGAWVRRIGGRRILFVNDMNGEHLQVYRFATDGKSEIGVPSGFFAKRHVSDEKDVSWLRAQPAKGEWIWRDANGNGAFDDGEFEQPTRGSTGNPRSEIPDAPAAQGWWVDARGNVWLATESAGLRLFPQGGLDPKGNPTWSYAQMQTFRAPAEFKQVKRIRYLPETDTLFLAGTTGEHQNQHWKPGGPVLARYDGWLKGDRKLRWRMVAPYAAGSQGHSSCEPMGFDVAGGFVFVPYTGASKPDNVKPGRVEIFRADDGTSVGHLEPSDYVGEIGLQDIRECLTAHRRAGGEFVVLLEDDYKSKIVTYRLKPGQLK